MIWNAEKTDEKRARGRDAKRRFDDRTAAIDAEIDAAMAEIDWDIRTSAEKDIVAWVKEYCVKWLTQSRRTKTTLSASREGAAKAVM